jgi:hypothetical protein
MATLGDDMWCQAEDGQTASVRLIRLQYAARCESKKRRNQLATVGVECRDRIGHPIWRRDFCQEHATPLISRARGLGIGLFWH